MPPPVFADRRRPRAEANHPLSPRSLLALLAAPRNVIHRAGAAHPARRGRLVEKVSGAARAACDEVRGASGRRKAEPAGEQIGARLRGAGIRPHALESTQGDPRWHDRARGKKRLGPGSLADQLVREPLGVAEAQRRHGSVPGAVVAPTRSRHAQGLDARSRSRPPPGASPRSRVRRGPRPARRSCGPSPRQGALASCPGERESSNTPPERVSGSPRAKLSWAGAVEARSVTGESPSTPA